jgi:two-component system, cell cycle sensor histidine kinase and response regulator CckA
MKGAPVTEPRLVAPSTRTKQRLRLGFGVLTALLATSIAVLLLFLQILFHQLEVLSWSSQRATAARQLEISVLEFARTVIDFGEMETPSPRVRDDAGLDEAQVALHLMQYQLLATTERHRVLAEHFGAAWLDLQERGTRHMDMAQTATSGEMLADAMAVRAAADRLELLLDNEMQPDSVDSYDHDKAELFDTAQLATIAAVALLCAGVVVAIATAMRVSRGVVATEAARVKGSAQLLATLEAMHDGIAVFDMNGNVLMKNRAMEELEAGPMPACLPSRTDPARARVQLYDLPGNLLRHDAWPAVRALRGETVRNLALQLGLDGAPPHAHFEFTATPVFEGSGVQTSALLLCRDVTDLRRAEAHLRQAQKIEAMGQLTGGIAHDFNNVLTAIIGNAQFLISEPQDEETQRECMVEIVDAARRGATMTSRLLAFSRQGMLVRQAMHPGQVIGGLAEMLRRLMPATIAVTMHDQTAGSDVVVGDLGALEQIVVNLCTNARDAMPAGGTIDLTTEKLPSGAVDHPPPPTPSDGWIRISVSDSGMGMDDQTRRRAFEPFFTTKAPGQGTGLGLAMVVGLVRQQGGHIELLSEPGRGTRVVLDLPARSIDVAPLAVQPRAATGVPPNNETILLVEDDPAIRRATLRALEHQGYAVIVANDGRDALARYEAHKDDIDLIVSDLVMPGLGGRELVNLLRSRGAKQPVLFVSGYSPGVPNDPTAFPEGAAFLPKPWEQDELCRAVRGLLDGNEATSG